MIGLAPLVSSWLLCSRVANSTHCHSSMKIKCCFSVFCDESDLYYHLPALRNQEMEFLPWDSLQTYRVRERACIFVAVMFRALPPLPDSSLGGLLHPLPSEGAFLSLDGRWGTGRIDGLLIRDHKSGGIPSSLHRSQLLSAR